MGKIFKVYLHMINPISSGNVSQQYIQAIQLKNKVAVPFIQPASQATPENNPQAACATGEHGSAFSRLKQSMISLLEKSKKILPPLMDDVVMVVIRQLEHI